MSTTHAPANHITISADGWAWISGTTFPVLAIVMDHVANGLSPEEIYFEHYEELPLAAIYAALAYYYDNKEAMDADIRLEQDDFDAAHQATSQSAFVRRIRTEGRIP